MSAAQRRKIIREKYRNTGWGTKLRKVTRGLQADITQSPPYSGPISEQYGWRNVFSVNDPPVLISVGVSSSINVPVIPSSPIDC